MAQSLRLDIEHSCSRELLFASYRMAANVRLRLD